MLYFNFLSGMCHFQKKWVWTCIKKRWVKIWPQKSYSTRTRQEVHFHFVTSTLMITQIMMYTYQQNIIKQGLTIGLLRTNRLQENETFSIQFFSYSKGLSWGGYVFSEFREGFEHWAYDLNSSKKEKTGMGRAYLRDCSYEWFQWPSYREIEF